MNKVAEWLKSYFSLLIAVALLITSAIFVGEGAGILADLDNDAQFLESDLVGEGDGENVEVETLEEMVDIYQSTALPLINNLINNSDEESEYDSLTVTLKTHMPGSRYASQMGVSSSAISGDINQYVMFAITKDVMVVKISTDSTMKMDYMNMKQDLTFTSVVEYYITQDNYFMKVVSFKGSDEMLQQQEYAYSMMSDEMGKSFSLLFNGQLKNEWVDVEGTQMASNFIDEGVRSCYNALSMLSMSVDENDFVQGETPELTISSGGATNTFQFKYINNTRVSKVTDVEVLADYLN